MDAEQAYKKAVALNPEFTEAHYNLASFYAKYKQDGAKALYHYKRYKDLGGLRTDLDEHMKKLVGAETPEAD